VAGAAAIPPDTTARGPALLVPAVPDSAPPESAPAPLLIPGRPAPPDSNTLSLAERARAAYQLGRQFEASGAPAVAIVSYRNALRFDPTLPDANYRMAKLFLTRDQVGEAVKCLLGELSHHPGNLDADRELGLCFARLGDSTRAIAHLDRLARAHPREGALWHALGSVYLSARRPRDAEGALRRALALEPTTPEELRDMGASQAALGREKEAKSYYRRALKRSPADPATWLNLGNLERRAARPDSALALYRIAELSDSSFVPALEAQVQLLRESGRDDEAADAYRRWLRHHPDHHGARLEGVRLLEALGREEEALALAREGAERAGDDGQPFLILGMLLQGRGDTRGAVAALRRAQALHSDRPAERERVARILAALQASVPDSLRAVLAADSVAATRRPRR
jgi:tetratricopeptide (TPR) repeat protein